MCKKIDLSFEDLEYMTVGMCLDYVEEYIDQNNPKRKKARNATQTDFDSF
ncbi:hypothetical protein [Oceanobacillus sp. E9]|nr:hypothetical protein [Oceanobacillus sp. E9]